MADSTRKPHEDRVPAELGAAEARLPRYAAMLRASADAAERLVRAEHERIARAQALAEAAAPPKAAEQPEAPARPAREAHLRERTAAHARVERELERRARVLAERERTLAARELELAAQQASQSARVWLACVASAVVVVAAFIVNFAPVVPHATRADAPGKSPTGEVLAARWGGALARVQQAESARADRAVVALLAERERRAALEGRLAQGAQGASPGAASPKAAHTPPVPAKGPPDRAGDCDPSDPCAGLPSARRAP